MRTRNKKTTQVRFSINRDMLSAYYPQSIDVCCNEAKNQQVSVPFHCQRIRRSRLLLNNTALLVHGEGQSKPSSTIISELHTSWTLTYCRGYELRLFVIVNILPSAIIFPCLILDDGNTFGRPDQERRREKRRRERD